MGVARLKIPKSTALIGDETWVVPKYMDLEHTNDRVFRWEMVGETMTDYIVRCFDRDDTALARLRAKGDVEER